MKRILVLVLIFVIILPTSYAQDIQGIDLLRFTIFTTMRAAQIGVEGYPSTDGFLDFGKGFMPYASVFNWMLFYDQESMEVYYGIGYFKIDWEDLENTYADFRKLLPGFSVFDYPNDIHDRIFGSTLGYSVQLSNKKMIAVIERTDFSSNDWDEPVFMEKIGDFDLYIRKMKNPDYDNSFSFEFVHSNLTHEEASRKTFER
jgi:hypothetical protein